LELVCKELRRKKSTFNTNISKLAHDLQLEGAQTVLAKGVSSGNNLQGKLYGMNQ
jgi:uncharacterized protein YoaH (UPF0181 family)